MPTLTTRPPTETLLLALDLGNTTWTLAVAAGGPAAPPRIRSMPARDLTVLRAELTAAKRRFGLPDDAPVVSCDEAGRDGFWLHRALTAFAVTNLVVDSASIEQHRGEPARPTGQVGSSRHRRAAHEARPPRSAAHRRTHVSPFSADGVRPRAP